LLSLALDRDLPESSAGVHNNNARDLVAPVSSTASASSTFMRYREVSRVNVQTSIEHTLRA